MKKGDTLFLIQEGPMQNGRILFLIQERSMKNRESLFLNQKELAQNGGNVYEVKKWRLYLYRYPIWRTASSTAD